MIVDDIVRYSSKAFLKRQIFPFLRFSSQKNPEGIFSGETSEPGHGRSDENEQKNEYFGPKKRFNTCRRINPIAIKWQQQRINQTFIVIRVLEKTDRRRSSLSISDIFSIMEIVDSKHHDILRPNSRIQSDVFFKRRARISNYHILFVGKLLLLTAEFWFQFKE